MSSLSYRKSRIDKICKEWNLIKVNSLIAGYRLPKQKFDEIKLAIKLYISKSLHFDYSDNDNDYMNNLKLHKENRINITPNGGVVPKKEHIIYYNLFLKTWSEIFRKMISKNPKLLNKFRLTPNVRIKYGQDFDDNIDRPLNTAHPHSDGWLEGPFGLNCHLPIMGDTNKNYLQFYELIDEKKFSDDFIELTDSYMKMNWVEKFYKINYDFIPEPGIIYFSDYALLHRTFRSKGCNDRISIDTTLSVGDHEIIADRLSEFSDTIPKFGEEYFCKINKSENEDFITKKTTFSHYAINTLEFINIYN